MFCRIRSCLRCHRANERSNCLFRRSIASKASLSGGGIKKTTPGMLQSDPLAPLDTRHLIRPELSCNTHCSPFSMESCNNTSCYFLETSHHANRVHEQHEYFDQRQHCLLSHSKEVKRKPKGGCGPSWQ